MSTVRPVSTGEERLAVGQPMDSLMAILGLQTGALAHMRIFNSTTKNMFPNAASRLVGFGLIGGGAFAGGYFGRWMFGDAGLRRLVDSHELDRFAAKVNMRGE